MLRILVVLFALLLFAPLSRAYEIVITADRLMADKERGYIYAEGNVYATMGEMSLWTKSLLYDDEKKTLYAFDRVIFYGEFLAQGEYLKYNLETKEGYLSKGEISFLSSDVKKRRFLWGEDIVIKDKETFFISKGGMSSCDGEKKPWHIKGEDISVELGEYLWSKHTKLYASSFPILYTPYFLAPIKSERESGFLIPSFGFSGKNGLVLNVPYYTVIDDSKDMTNTLLIKTKTSVGLDNQFRYMLSQRERGEMDITLIDNFDIKKPFFAGKLKHAKEAEGENLKVDLDYVNRKDYFSLYAGDSYDKTKPYTRSTAFYEKEIKGSLYSAFLFFSQDMTGTAKEIRYLKATKEGYLKQYGNASYNINGALSAFSKKGEAFAGKAEIEPFFFFRLNDDIKGIYSRASLLVIDYLNSPEKDSSDLTGLARADFGGYINKNLIVNDKYKVVNEFWTELVLPYRLNDAIKSPIDKNDILDNTKKLRYGYEGKWYDMKGLGRTFYLSLSQDYILSKDGEGSNYFSDLFFLSRYSRKELNLNVMGSYDHSSNRFRELTLSGDYKIERIKTAVSYYRNEGGEEFLNLDLSSKIGYNTEVMAGTRYDIKNNLFRELSVGAEATRSCYSLKAVVTRKDLPREYLVMFTVNLFGLGEFKQAY